MRVNLAITAHHRRETFNRNKKPEQRETRHEAWKPYRDFEQPIKRAHSSLAGT